MKILFAVIALSVSGLAAAQVTCTPGYYDAGSAGCKKCPLGTYQPEGGQTECKPCPDGYVSMVQGSTKCLRCDKPNEEPTEFKDSCKCILGSAPDRNGACQLCPPGHYMQTRANGKGQFCRICNYYEFQPKAGQTKCRPCPDDSTANDDRTSCFGCPEGERILDLKDGKKCGTCGPGQYVFVDTCAGCDDAYFYCQDCEAGTFKTKVGLEDCSPCPRNHYSMTGATKCFACPEGKAPIGKNGRCGTCPPGTFYDQASFRCTKCTRQSFQPEENIREQCFQCSSDTNAVEGSTTCGKCPSGEALMKDGTCGSCPPGTEYDEYELNCRKCEPNEYSDSHGVDECLRCPRYKYSLPGSSECNLTCPSGQVMLINQKGKKYKTRCVACPPGSSYNPFSPEECQDCKEYGPRYASPGGDAIDCKYCERGSIANADATACRRLGSS